MVDSAPPGSGVVLGDTLTFSTPPITMTIPARPFWNGVVCTKTGSAEADGTTNVSPTPFTATSFKSGSDEMLEFTLKSALSINADDPFSPVTWTAQAQGGDGGR